MPQVYRRRAEFVVAEEAPAGGTVSTRNGIIPIAGGDMMVHTGGEAQHYSAADFAQQFEAVGYDDTPEHLREIADPERAQKEREEAAEKAERDARREERRPSGSSGGGGRSGKTTKSRSSRGASTAAHRQTEERKAERERQEASETALQDQGDFAPQPTSEAQRNWGE